MPAFGIYFADVNLADVGADAVRDGGGFRPFRGVRYRGSDRRPVSSKRHADFSDVLLALTKSGLVVERTFLQAPINHFGISNWTHKNQGYVGELGLDVSEQSRAIHFCHQDVGRDQIKSCSRSKQRESFNAGARGFALVTFGAEHRSENVADGFFVIHDKDAIGHAIPLCRSV
jgi:hypothetical protein